MSDKTSIIASVEAVQEIMAALPAAAREPESGISYDDGALLVPPSFADAALAAAATAAAPDAGERRRKAVLLAHAAARRHAVETGGIMVGDRRIDTSRDSQSMISAAHAYVTAADVAEVSFKASSGWVTLTDVELQAVALSVGAHVQACFEAERVIAAAIEAGTITTATEIDAAAWPAN